MNCPACGNQPSVGRFHRTCVERLLAANTPRSTPQ